MPRRKKDPKSLPSFPDFLKLPWEIQDEIWKHALDNDVPSAHIVDFTVCIQELASSSPIKVYMSCMTATGYGSSRAKSVSSPSRSLMQTCQRSRQAVKRRSQKWEYEDHPPTQFQLRLHPYPDLHPFFHSERRIERAWLGHKIYTSHDLVILSDPWSIGEISSELRENWQHETRIPLKYVAIPYYPSETFWLRERRSVRNQGPIGDMLRVFDDLRVLYILIQPDIIHKGERLEVLNLLPEMKGHLDKYKRTSKEATPKRFLYRDRVYHEISDVLLLKLGQLGGLPRAVTGLEWIAKNQRRGRDKPPLIIRFMTW